MPGVSAEFKRSKAWRALKSSMAQGHTLYDQLRDISIYKYHRDTLRPWDRQLPVTVQHEANQRDAWRSRPPSTGVICLVLLACLLVTQLIAVLPFVSNLSYIDSFWADIDKPDMVYQNTPVLFAVYVVTHLATGFALWFIYLAEGFEKHQVELLPFALAMLLECVWVDTAFNLGRLDLTLLIAVSVVVLTIMSQILLVLFRVHIAAIFLCPHLAGTIGITVYVAAFMNLHGSLLTKVVSPTKISP